MPKKPRLFDRKRRKLSLPPAKARNSEIFPSFSPKRLPNAARVPQISRVCPPSAASLRNLQRPSARRRNIGQLGRITAQKGGLWPLNQYPSRKDRFLRSFSSASAGFSGPTNQPHELRTEHCRYLKARHPRSVLSLETLLHHSFIQLVTADGDH